MAFDPAQKTDEKQGLLALGLQEGQSLPFLDEAGLSTRNRINKRGRVEWVVRDPDLLQFDLEYPFKKYISKKEEQIYRDIFRNLRMLMRAIMGLSIPPHRVTWIQELGILELFPTQSDATQWEEAPRQIQDMAQELSTAEYLKPQLS